MSGAGAGGGSGTTWREQMASVWAPIAVAAVAPVASADRSARLMVRSMPASSASRLAAGANGTAVAARAVILARPGDIELCALPRPASLGARPCPQAAQWYQARRTVTGPSTVSKVLA